MWDKKNSLEHAKYMLDDAVQNIEAWFKKNTQLLPSEIIQAEHNLKQVKRYIDSEIGKEEQKMQGYIHPGQPNTQPDYKDVRISRSIRR